MNKNEFQKGIDDINKIGLKPTEKSLLWQKLSSYADSSFYEPISSPWYIKFEHFAFSRQGGLVFSVFVLFLASFNTIFYAEKSLPGDKLYPLKVDIFEPLKSSLTFDGVSKAEIEVSNLNERLKEAEILESQGKLSEVIQQDIEQRVVNHTDSFNMIISNLDSFSQDENSQEKTEDVKIDYEAKINAHSRILGSLGNSGSVEVQKIRDLVQSKVSNSVNARNFNVESPVPMMFSSSLATDTATSSTDQSAAENATVTSKMAASSISSTTSSTTTSTTSNKTNSKINSATNTRIQINSNFNLKRADTEKIIKQAKESIDRIKTKQQVNRVILEDAENSIKEAESFLKEANDLVNSGDTEGAIFNLLNSRKSAKEADTSIEVSLDLEGRD